MANIDNLSVGPSLSQAGLRGLSLPGKAPRSGKFKELTLSALAQPAIVLKEPDESIPEVAAYPPKVFYSTHKIVAVWPQSFARHRS